MQYSNFYDNLDALDFVIDWQLMTSKYWSDTENDPDRKRRRQAEFLVYEFCFWDLITEIGVINSTIQRQVQEILKNFNDSTPVKVYSNWYY